MDGIRLGIAAVLLWSVAGIAQAATFLLTARATTIEVSSYKDDIPVAVPAWAPAVGAEIRVQALFSIAQVLPIAAGLNRNIFTVSALSASIGPYAVLDTSGTTYGAGYSGLGNPIADFVDFSFLALPPSSVPVSSGYRLAGVDVDFENYSGALRGSLALQAGLPLDSYFYRQIVFRAIDGEGQGVNFLGRTVTASLIAVPDGTTLAVPEPATWASFIGGFGMIGGAMRRRARRHARAA